MTVFVIHVIKAKKGNVLVTPVSVNSSLEFQFVANILFYSEVMKIYLKRILNFRQRHLK